MKSTHFHFQWSSGALLDRFATGVSLHSHTLQSKESLGFIYKAARRLPLLGTVVEQAERRYRKHFGVALDFNRGWWTPPLAPLDAHEVEAGQIESLGLKPFVSLTDHDDIEAAMSLQALDASRCVPVSVEWTMPYGLTFFHVGIHNMPPASAREIMGRLSVLTETADVAGFEEILSELSRIPEVLIVLNHPLWDEKGIGGGVHEKAALELLSRLGDYIHAFEVNGLRPWSENVLAIRLASNWSKPIVAGGDRHALEPNAIVNVSQAATFPEFVSEVREGVSDVLVMSHYRQAHSARIVHNFAGRAADL
jgi:hypothetical protein